MNPKQERRVIAQIIQELSLFLLYHGYQSFDIGLESQPSQEVFVVKVAHMSDELLNQIRTQIEQPREESIEQYYFELLGELDSKENLELLGIFIDSMTVTTQQDHIIIQFIRKK